MYLRYYHISIESYTEDGHPAIKQRRRSGTLQESASHIQRSMLHLLPYQIY